MPDINGEFEERVEAQLAATAPYKGQIELPSDAVLFQHWKNFGGEIHGPRVETVTMPEAQFYPFMRHMLTLMFLEGVKAVITPAVKPTIKKAFVPLSERGLSISVAMGYETVDDPLLKISFDGNVNATFTTIGYIFNGWFGEHAFEKMRSLGEMAIGDPKLGWAIFLKRSTFEANFTRREGR